MTSFAIEDYHSYKWKSEIRGKKFLIKYSPKDNFGKKCFMIFKYFEDYEKLKILNKMIGNIIHKLDSKRTPKRIKFEREVEELENFVKKCKYFKIDYVDGRFYRIKFYAINRFMQEGLDDFLFFAEKEGDMEYHYTINLKNTNVMLENVGLIAINP